MYIELSNALKKSESDLKTSSTFAGATRFHENAWLDKSSAEDLSRSSQVYQMRNRNANMVLLLKVNFALEQDQALN